MQSNTDLQSALYVVENLRYPRAKSQIINSCMFVLNKPTNGKVFVIYGVSDIEK